MTGNKCYLGEYKDYNGGFVSFGDRKGRISRKGKIKTGSLDFDDVYFYKELKYNLFSVSQICDKKNNVLFTDTECLVLSSNFKLLDESQVLLRVPRKDTIRYNPCATHGVEREEAQAVRSSLAQVRAMVAEMEATNDLDEYYDSLRSGMANGVSVLFCIVLWLMNILPYLVYMGPFLILDKLSDVVESPRLAAKMKYMFSRSRGEDESFAKLMCDLCFALMISLSKKRRLVAELEASREWEGAAKPFEHMKEIVARDAVTLEKLETLLARAQVGVSLKGGFVADMEERE
ncbi:hypothetical protein Tco_0696970 [Tanacetum coccineum]